MKSILLFFIVIILSNQSAVAQQVIPITPNQVQTIIKQKADKKAVLVNVWATWCGPCIEEFPDIIEIAQKYKKDLDVVFISADFIDDLPRVKEFLFNQKVTWPTYIKTGSETEFIEALHPKWSGALPFSFILKQGGQEIAYWENKAELSKFEAFVKKAIQPKSEK